MLKKWFTIAFAALLITASIGVYSIVSRPSSANFGGVEGYITDELGHGLTELRVSIIGGSVGFPEMAVSTAVDGYYQLGSIPQGSFTLAVHDDMGEILTRKTFQVEGGKTTKLDIVLGGLVLYDNYGGVGLFEQGIYVITTDKDPRVLKDSVEFSDEVDYWTMVKDSVTQNPSSDDFVSILISRGDQPTGGYQIQVKSLVWLESYPVVGFFKANFTDPSEDGPVVEAETNPMALVPLGQLSPGLYVGRVHIDSFTMYYDSGGEPVYNPIETLVEEVGETDFEVS